MDRYPAPRMPIVVAIFAAVGLVSAIARAVSSATVRREVGFGRLLIHQEGIWLLFAALAPLVFWTARRYPLGADRLSRSVPAHLLTFAAMSLAHTVVYTTAMQLSVTGDAAQVITFVRHSWIGNMRADVFVYAILVGGYYLHAYALWSRSLQQTVLPETSAQALPAGGRLAVRDRGRITFVEVDDIEAIEADGDYVRVRAGGRSHLVRETLRSMEQSLDARRFLRIHRSTIVNVSRIRELQPHQHGEFFVIMTSGTRLKVSRNYRAGIAAAVKVR